MNVSIGCQALIFYNRHYNCSLMFSIISIQVPLLYNIQWKELGLLVFVWVAFLTVQIMKVSYFPPSTAIESTCAVSFSKAFGSLQVFFGFFALLVTKEKSL